jgi:hypothetical protein
MPTSKKPRFIHPPLEVGVPTYPTPSVPDFYKKDGHIILMEKVSAEKGAYNPLPLDGSVTYKGRDANKWPSTLYLVAQRPTPDGEFVMRFWANDRSLASQNAWNYNITYSAENPDFPVYSRQYIIPRSKYKTSGYPPFVLGTPDPIAGGNTKITKQTMMELGDENPLRSRYVSVQVIYETIPGPVITSHVINSFGAAETNTKQLVTPATIPDSTYSPSRLLVSDTVNAVDSTKSMRETKIMDAYPVDFSFYEVTHDLATVKNTIQMKLRSDITPPQPSDFDSGVTLDINDSPIAFPWIRRTIKSLPVDGYGNPILPPTRIEHNTITYTFPGIIYSWQANLEIGPDGKKSNAKAQFSFFENRFPISMMITAKNVITYHVGEQDLSGLNFWAVTTRPWAKIYFNLPDDTIHPPAPASLTNQAANRGGVAYAIAGGQASSPSTYIPGQELLIGGDCKRWQGNIFMKRLVYVQEPV